jgi:hypothetical protein
VWDESNGARPFIRWIGDQTQGATDLGTDGVDLVWSYGEGKAPNEIVYPVRSIMTAPFTTDPMALQATRLRSQPYPTLGVHQFKVGCGFGMQETGGNGLLIIRLSDGISWTLPHLPGQFLPLGPIGLTCDEAFMFVQIGGRATIARIRLDSLGPGIPPD